MIPVNSIEIPGQYLDLCSDWYDGINDMLYAVASTGGLTIGNIRPRGCDSDEKWYLTIWRELSADAGRARRDAGNEDVFGEGGHDDYDDLNDFEDWVEKQVARLEESYGLADWDAYDD